MTSSMPGPAGTQDRRSHPRKEGLAYVDFGTGNAGILSNLNECGLAFNGIGILEKGQTFPFRFTMPGKSDFIEATGQIVWVSDSKKSGGLKFLEIPEEIRSLIRAWASISTVPTDRSEKVAAVSAVAQTQSPGAPPLSAASSKNPEGHSAIGFADTTSGPSLPAALMNDASPRGSEPEQSVPDTARPPMPRGKPDEDKIVKVRFELPDTGIQARGQYLQGERTENGRPLRVPDEAQAELNKWSASTEQAKAAEGHPSPMAPLPRQPEVTEEARFASRESSKNLSSVSPQDLSKKNETPQPPFFPSAVRSVGGSDQTTGARPPSQVEISGAMTRLASPKMTAGQAQQKPEQRQSLSPPTPSNIPAAVTNAARSAGKQINADRPAVLSRAAKQREILKASLALRFVAGVAVGCVALATIAGGLVATGRLRLVELTPASSNAPGATAIPGERIQDQGDQRQTSENSESSGISTGTTPSYVAAEPPAGSEAPALAVGAPLLTASPAAKPAARVKRDVTPVQKTPATPPPARIIAPQEDSPRTGNAPGLGASAGVPASTDASAFEPPVLVSYTDPVYPPAARAAQVQGNVEVVATIGTDGIPRSLRITSGDPQLGAAAIAAISNWRYRPATVNGQFEESLITIAVKFAL